MRTKVRRWGNSLAVRIPKGFADDTGLTEDADVDIRSVAGTLVIEPVTNAGYDLRTLLAGVTPENLHGEVEMGRARGAEAW